MNPHWKHHSSYNFARKQKEKQDLARILIAIPTLLLIGCFVIGIVVVRGQRDQKSQNIWAETVSQVSIPPTESLNPSPDKQSSKPATEQKDAQEKKQKEKPAKEKKRQITVYVTNTGSKYHTGGCRYLRKSRIPVSLESARNGYSPCSVCNPPQ